MKITKEYLKRVIAEEIDRTLSEGKKMKIAVKGKKKSLETEGAFGANYDDYDYVRDSAPGPLSDYERERREAERKQLQQWRDEESEKRSREYRQMDDYDRSTRSDESMDPKKKVKN